MVENPSVLITARSALEITTMPSFAPLDVVSKQLACTDMPPNESPLPKSCSERSNPDIASQEMYTRNFSASRKRNSQIETSIEALPGANSMNLNIPQGTTTKIMI